MLRRLLLTLLLVPAPALGQSDAGAGVAPPGRWPLAGGSPARSGHSAAEPLRDPPAEAWHLDLRGVPEGEPRVWDGVITLSLRESSTRRSIQRLELATGRTLLHQVLPAAQPLELAVFDDRVAVRPAPDRVDLYRVRAGRLFHLRTVRARRSLSTPLFVEGRLLLRVDDDLVAYDPNRPDPLWRAEGAQLGARAVGELAAREAVLYALAYEPRGNARVLALALDSGELLASTDAGHHGGQLPGADAPADLVVLEHALFITYPLPVPASSGTELSHGRLGRGSAPDGTPVLGQGALHQRLTAPTPVGAGWVSLEGGETGARWIESQPVPEGLRLVTLADARDHAELLDTRVPATRAGDVLYLGGLAYDLETREILWKRPAPRLRPVPVDDYLLVVEGERRLTALRGEARHATPAQAHVAELTQQLERDTAEAFAALARESLALSERPLTARLVAEAVSRGARGPMLDSARQGLERLPELGSAPRPGPNRRRDALLAKEIALAGATVEGLLERSRTTRDPDQRIALLRAVLERNPSCEEARLASEALVPAQAPHLAGVAPREQAMSWLDFLDVQRRTPLRFVVDGAQAAATAELELMRAQADGWRPDLVGFRSERLLVLTGAGRSGRPGAGPGEVARCLEIGELVCNLLEEVFGAPAGSGPPMTLLLFADRDTYIAHSRASGSGPENGFDWTAGHYSSRENLSRMFVPAADDDLQRLLGVYAHELTHHWLATRAPFASRFADRNLPYWIVEGFASLIEEFRLDPWRGTWDPINPRAESLDIVAHAAAGDLLPWSRVLTMDHTDFARLDARDTVHVPLGWRLGVRSDQNAIGLYYAQAGALCHHLFHSSEADRARLLETVAAWYEQRRGSGLYGPYGRSAEELGRQVVEFARRSVR